MSDAQAKSKQASNKKALSVKDEGQDFSLRQHDIRALICFAVAATAFTHIQFNNLDQYLLWLGCFVVGYTIASYIIIKRCVNQDAAFDRFTMIDAALIGALLTFSGYSLLPTIMFVTLVQFNSLINGGPRKWAIDNIALISSALICFFISCSLYTLPIPTNPTLSLFPSVLLKKKPTVISRRVNPLSTLNDCYSDNLSLVDIHATR